MPILIHKSRKFEYAASPNRSIKIINEEKLESLKSNLKNLSQEVAINSNDVNKVDELLKACSFKGTQFIDEYTVSFE